MEQLGSTTKTLLFKGEPHKLRHAFKVKELTHTITLNADLVTSNTINGTVNGVSFTEVTFATDHATTLTAVANAIAAIPGVRSATVTAARVITVVYKDQSLRLPVITIVVASGASQAVATMAIVDNTIRKSQPVKLNTAGKLVPAAANENPINIIGHAEHNGFGDDLVTVSMKAQAIFFAEAGITSMLAGPIKYASFNSVTNRCKYSSTSVDYTSACGWSLGTGTNVGDEILVALN